jgi:hypothetical protein
LSARLVWAESQSICAAVLPRAAYWLINTEQNSSFISSRPSRYTMLMAYQEIFFSVGSKKFNWGQRADRTGIWGR